MRLTRISFALMVATLLASSASAQTIATESASDANFASYKTFVWIKPPNVTDPIMRHRIVDDVNAQLAAKGLKPATEGADLGVAVHMATKTEQTLHTFYDGFGGGWRWGGSFGSATTTVDTYQEGTLIVDLFDGTTKEAVWRGTATQGISSNPEKRAKNMAKAIAKLFQKFPPAAASSR